MRTCPKPLFYKLARKRRGTSVSAPVSATSPPYDVAAIDINGSSIQGTLTLSGGSQDSGVQFVCE